MYFLKDLFTVSDSFKFIISFEVVDGAYVKMVGYYTDAINFVYKQ